MQVEISYRTGYVHEDSWQFWMMRFTLGEFFRLKAIWRDTEVFHIEDRIWNKMCKSPMWINWISTIDTDGLCMLAGVKVKVID